MNNFNSVFTRTMTDMQAKTEDSSLVTVDGDIRASAFKEDADSSASREFVHAEGGNAEAQWIEEDHILTAQSHAVASGMVNLRDSGCMARGSHQSTVYCHVPVLDGKTTKASGYSRSQAAGGQFLAAKLGGAATALIAGRMSIKVTYDIMAPGDWKHNSPVYTCECVGGQFLAAQRDEDRWQIIRYLVATAEHAFSGNLKTFTIEYVYGDDLDISFPFFYFLGSGITEVPMYGHINDIGWQSKTFLARAHGPEDPPDKTSEVHALVVGSAETKFEELTVYVY